MKPERQIQPCIYPRCDRGTNGDPALTTEGICRRCQSAYRRMIEDLVLYWVRLRTDMPTPVRRQGEIRTKDQTYGHPAEWASDTARRITDKLNDAHDELADHLHQTPPPHPGTTEAGRINKAYQYLTPRIPALSAYPAAEDTAIDLYELRSTIKAALGLTRGYTRLRNVPCMACNTCALIVIDDTVICGECGATTPHEHFGLLARHAIDALIDAYDQAKVATTN